MNFLAHYVIATCFLTPSEPLAAYVVGTALPDLLPLAAARVRLRPAQMEQATARTEFEAALSAGMSVHLATDAAFHKSVAFAEAQAEVSQLLAKTAFDGIRVRRFFAAHILTELVLDAVLLREEPALADKFYHVSTGADSAAVTQWAEAITGKSLPNLTAVLARFAQSGYLRGYAEDAGVATGFSKLCRRAGQDTFDGDNFKRLAGVVGGIAAWLPKRVPALLSETTAGILQMRQELTGAAANAVRVPPGTTARK